MRRVRVLQVAVSHPGGIDLFLNEYAERWLHFDRFFKRVGWDGVSDDSMPEQSHFNPTDDRRWIVGYREVVLTRAGLSLVGHL
ncbi:MAG: hypothetical protein ACJASX_002885, partial [Limisphaerales bacterium]